ncbi:MAG: phosphatase PAP2 family protein, partial [bacterium]|nr:phosphatase PAP2 family protein [bacterium]
TLAFACLASFFLLTISAKFDKTQIIDFDTTVKIQDKMPLRLKPYMITFVQLGSWQIMSVLVFVSMLIHRKYFWQIGLLYIFIAIVEVFGKHLLHHPPPPHFMTLRFQDLDLPKYYVRQEASYPSGHAARSAFLVFIWVPYITQSTYSYFKRNTTKIISDFTLNLPFGFKLTRPQSFSFKLLDFSIIAIYISTFFALTTFTFLIGIIKVYLGEHWISDVIGGWLLGTGLGLLIVSRPFFSD